MSDQATGYAPIAERLIGKANMQQVLLRDLAELFELLKELLHEFSTELDELLEGELDRHVRIEYRDRGKFEAQLQVGGEVLIFMMHTNAFRIEEQYCGVIHIYNFLADSFKYNRNADEGYLIGRVWVDGARRFLVEGKMEQTPAAFSERTLDRGALRELIGRAVAYALDFDMLPPPYDLVKVVTLDQLGSKFEATKLVTGKRLGREF